MAPRPKRKSSNEIKPLKMVTNSARNSRRSLPRAASAKPIPKDTVEDSAKNERVPLRLPPNYQSDGMSFTAATDLRSRDNAGKPEDPDVFQEPKRRRIVEKPVEANAPKLLPEETTTERPPVPKTHSFAIVKESSIGAVAGNSNDNDSALDLVDGENWVMLHKCDTSNLLLENDNTQGTYGTEHTAASTASLFPSIYSTRETGTNQTVSSMCFLCVDIDGTHCAVKDMRGTDDPDAHSSDDSTGEGSPATCRVFLCRASQATILNENSWEDLSYRRQQRHLSPGDKLIFVQSAQTSTGFQKIRLILEHSYEATIRATPMEEGNEFVDVSQLENPPSQPITLLPTANAKPTNDRMVPNWRNRVLNRTNETKDDDLPGDTKGSTYYLEGPPKLSPNPPSTICNPLTSRSETKPAETTEEQSNLGTQPEESDSETEDGINSHMENDGKVAPMQEDNNARQDSMPAQGNLDEVVDNKTAEMDASEEDYVELGHATQTAGEILASLQAHSATPEQTFDYGDVSDGMQQNRNNDTTDDNGGVSQVSLLTLLIKTKALVTSPNAMSSKDQASKIDESGGDHQTSNNTQQDSNGNHQAVDASSSDKKDCFDSNVPTVSHKNSTGVPGGANSDSETEDEGEVGLASSRKSKGHQDEQILGKGVAADANEQFKQSASLHPSNASKQDENCEANHVPGTAEKNQRVESLAGNRIAGDAKVMNDVDDANMNESSKKDSSEKLLKARTEKVGHLAECIDGSGANLEEKPMTTAEKVGAQKSAESNGTNNSARKEPEAPKRKRTRRTFAGQGKRSLSFSASPDEDVANLVPDDLTSDQQRKSSDRYRNVKKPKRTSMPLSTETIPASKPGLSTVATPKANDIESGNDELSFASRPVATEPPSSEKAAQKVLEGEDNGISRTKNSRGKRGGRSIKVETKSDSPVATETTGGRKRVTRTPRAKSSASKRATPKSTPARETSPQRTKINVMVTGHELTVNEKKFLVKMNVNVIDDDGLDDFAQVTHVIFYREKGVLKRTPKLMVGMCCADELVSSEWITDSMKKKTLLPHEQYRIPDNESLKGCNIARGLEKGRELREKGLQVLSGRKIAFCKGVAGNRAPPIEQLEVLVKASGATWEKPKQNARGLKNESGLLLITSDPPTADQQKLCKALPDGNEWNTVGWFFETLMKQEWA